MKEDSHIKKGMYVKTEDIADTAQWKKIVDAFVEAGANPCDGYGSGCQEDYSDGIGWEHYRYFGIDCLGDTVHYDYLGNYACDGDQEEGITEVTVDFILNGGVKEKEEVHKKKLLTIPEEFLEEGAVGSNKGITPVLVGVRKSVIVDVLDSYVEQGNTIIHDSEGIRLLQNNIHLLTIIIKD